MPYTVSLPDSTFAMLQALAKPFVDTPESLIASLAEEELQRRGSSSGAAPAVAEPENVARLNPDHPESLTHSKLLAASIDGKDLHRPKWNGLLDSIHIVAYQRLGSFDAIQRISGAHLRRGRYEEEGFRYLAEADLSIQGVDSNLAWTHSLGIARHLKVPISVKFEWRDKDGAARPGQTAILEWKTATLSVA